MYQHLEPGYRYRSHAGYYPNHLQSHTWAHLLYVDRDRLSGKCSDIDLDTIVAEVPSSRVRGYSMVIGRAGYVAGGIIMNQLKPRMLNADGW